MTHDLSRAVLKRLDIMDLLSTESSIHPYGSASDKLARVANVYQSMVLGTPLEYEIRTTKAIYKIGDKLSLYLADKISESDIKHALCIGIEGEIYRMFTRLAGASLVNYTKEDIEEEQSSALYYVVENMHKFNMDDNTYSFSTWFRTHTLIKCIDRLDIANKNTLGCNGDISERTRNYMNLIQRAICIIQMETALTESQISDELIYKVLSENYKLKRGPYDYIPPIDKIGDLRKRIACTTSVTLETMYSYIKTAENKDSSQLYKSIDQQILDFARIDELQNPEDLVTQRVVGAENEELNMRLRTVFKQKVNLVDYFYIMREYDFESEVAFLPPNTPKNRTKDLLVNQDFINACLATYSKFSKKVKIVDGIRMIDDVAWVRKRRKLANRNVLDLLSDFFSEEVLLCDSSELNGLYEDALKVLDIFGNPLKAIASLIPEYDARIIALRT